MRNCKRCGKAGEINWIWYGFIGRGYDLCEKCRIQIDKKLEKIFNGVIYCVEKED